ncbi:hypothetical protein PMIN06_012583 [Paraphaeosphaeria minitans]|uniref:Ankyrin repeat protein n=1 Tax=Paraphaeosphaeria minitans TaxID=565426 RepID=A0A9P6G8T5_9PLEO|nr:ankyrin repeat protein [Paraphaeosphaeria minitans]
MWVVLEKRPRTLKILLQERPGVQLKENWLFGALMMAADGGHGIMVKILLNSGINIGASIDYYYSALDLAARGGHAHVVKLVLETCAAVFSSHDRMFNGHGYLSSVLKSSSERGHEQVVVLLLNAGAPTNEDADTSISALQMATAEGHEQVVKLLSKLVPK